MKICVAQTKPFKGNIQKNIETHIKLINLAVSFGAELIAFPELSLTGYEPKLAKDLATNQDDSIFDNFQKISNANQINICVGIPTNISSGVQISMIILQPDEPRQTYSKQYLHKDEFPYFVNGQNQVFLTINSHKIAPAICYESLLPAHSENAYNFGADIYISSVAKSTTGVEKAFKHYPEIAKKYSMVVLMANSVGHCDDFECVGKTSIWNNKGTLVGQLNDTDEGILMFDTETQELTEKTI